MVKRPNFVLYTSTVLGTIQYSWLFNKTVFSASSIFLCCFAVSAYYISNGGERRTTSL